MLARVILRDGPWDSTNLASIIDPPSKTSPDSSNCASNSINRLSMRPILSKYGSEMADGGVVRRVILESESHESSEGHAVSERLFHYDLRAAAPIWDTLTHVDYAKDCHRGNDGAMWGRQR